MTKQDTLTRIAFLHHILKFITDDPNEFLALRIIHSSWDECIIRYSEEAWNRIYIKYRYADKNTLLHMCALRNTWMIEIFLNFDLNSTNGFNSTPLHSACRYDHVKCAELLLKKGADINALNYSNITPLYYACEGNNTECVKLLLENGANMEIGGYQHGGYYTPLHIACSIGHIECTNLLFEHGANIKATNSAGMTPLQCAYFHKKMECVKLLQMVPVIRFP